MLEVICLDSDGNSISCFNQWDSYQKLIIDGMNYTTAPEVHFCNEKSEMAMRVQSILLDDGKIQVDVPNELLLEPLKLIAYVYTLSTKDNGNTSGRTVQIAEIPVRKRLKPDGFIFKENVHVVQLSDLINEVKELNIAVTNAENIRNSAEEIRKENELERESSETNRVLSEEQRINNETERISKFEELVTNTEQIISDTNDVKIDAINATSKANEATTSAITAAQNATESADNADTATSAAILATENANQATQSALDAKELAISAADNANNVATEIQNKADNGDFSATVQIGEVATGTPGTNAKVENVGTTKDAIFNFTIPKGDTGSVENINESVIEFEESETQENVSSGDSLSTLFGKVQKLFSDIPSIINTAILNSHPIGSIYMTVNNINPSTYIGGEWVAWGSGRVPVGVNAADPDFNTPEKTMGEKTHKLLASEIPVHAHNVPAHTHGLNNHTHTTNAFNVASDNESANHTHNFSVNTSDTSKVLTGVFKALQWQTGTASGIVSQATNKTDRAASAGTQMGHNTFTIDATHHHLVSGTTGGISTNHAHTVRIPATTSNAASGSTALSGEFNTGNAGSGNAHNNLQPSITCYMWKRTA